MRPKYHTQLLLILAAFFPLCSSLAGAGPAISVNDAVMLVPAEYRHALVQQLSLAEEKQQQWLDTIARSPAGQREALAFLLANMPERDLKSLTGDFVLHDIQLAFQARAKTPWAAAVPDEIFLNDVVPYANLNERREDWRSDFFQQFSPLVSNCKTAGEAAQVLNREVFKRLNVGYHARKRKKPDQSPSESMAIHFASCSGLSIILADACRAVGIPARVAGTALWADGSGNHTWVEVWDGQWRFVGAAEPGEFNKTWFAALAAKADDARPEQRMHAASFRKTREPFLLVWDPQCTDYPAVDVTQYYVKRRTLAVTFVDASNKSAQTTARIRLADELIAQEKGASLTFELAANQTYALSVESAGKPITLPVTLPADRDLTLTINLATGAVVVK